MSVLSEKKKINPIQDTYIYMYIYIYINIYIYYRMRIFCDGVNEKELWPSYPPCLSRPQSYSIESRWKLSDVLVKSFLMGTLMMGLEGARVGGCEHGFPPGSAGLRRTQTSSS